MWMAVPMIARTLSGLVCARYVFRHAVKLKPAFKRKAEKPFDKKAESQDSSRPFISKQFVRPLDGVNEGPVSSFC